MCLACDCVSEVYMMCVLYMVFVSVCGMCVSIVYMCIMCYVCAVCGMFVSVPVCVNVPVCKEHSHVLMGTYACVYTCTKAKCYLSDAALQKASTVF